MTRTIAFLVDAAVIDLVAAVVAGSVSLVLSLLPNSGKHHSTLVAVGAVLFVVWSALYFMVFWATTGQTPGDRLMQIRVTRSDGTRLGVGHGVRRLVGLLLAILPLGLGLVPILLTDRRRGFHDWFADTVVVHSSADADPPDATP